MPDEECLDELAAVEAARQRPPCVAGDHGASMNSPPWRRRGVVARQHARVGVRRLDELAAVEAARPRGWSGARPDDEGLDELAAVEGARLTSLDSSGNLTKPR